MKAIGPVGLFLLTLASACSLCASTDSRVYNFMAERRICYDQTDASTVLPAEYDTYQGCVGIYESGPESFFSTVALTWPNSSTTNIEMETDGDVVDISKGYWVCYLLPDAFDFGWGFVYASGGWWCITSDNVAHWLTPQDHLPVLIR